jgi:hypothetical protein
MRAAPNAPDGRPPFPPSDHPPTLTPPSPNAAAPADLKSLPGVTAPFNDVFDPAGLSATAKIEDIRRWRESVSAWAPWLG